MSDNKEREQYFEEYDKYDVDTPSPYPNLLASARMAVKEMNFTKEDAADSFGVKVEDI